MGSDLIENVLQTIQEYQRIPSKQLKKLYEGYDLQSAIAKLVEQDLIVLDDLPPKDIWILKKKQ